MLLPTHLIIACEVLTKLMSCKHFCLQASFVATGNRTDISLEDPDFWQKWAKKAELDLDAINGRVWHRHCHIVCSVNVSTLCLDVCSLLNSFKC